MGLFDFFKKREPAEQRDLPITLPQLCYDMAYFVLPHYVHEDFPKLKGMYQSSPVSAGAFFYVMACQVRKVEPDIETAKRFRWQAERVDGAIDCLTLSYPTPPPIDMSNISMADMMKAGVHMVLAPYFSSAVCDRHGRMHYFILGQAPIGGGTTLRCITPDSTNCNLGPGPTPRMEDFHAAVADRLKG